MKISTLLDHIDNGHMALPEFQRGYVWNREQVRGLFESLYRRHPVGGLLVWATQANSAKHRGDGPLGAGVVKLLLDGQQRMTSLYGVVRGRPPEFFDGNERAFRELRFHLESETFSFYQPVKMRGDPLWIDVTLLMQSGTAGLGSYLKELSLHPDHCQRVGDYAGRLSQLLGIVEVDLHVEEVTGDDKTIDVVVDIFNRVNSGGTKLSKGDLALAKIGAGWHGARDAMKEKLRAWNDVGYAFNLDWLLRSINTTVTGEAKFSFLHERSPEEIRDGLESAARQIDRVLNMVAGRLGLDHDRVFFGRFAVPVMVRYLDQCNGTLNARDQDKLLFWFAQAGMWGRFSGSTESLIDQDLAVLEGSDGDLDALIENLRISHGGLQIDAGHFKADSIGARFYPVLYMLTRMGESRDWGTGLPLKASMLGKLSRLEVHHIFPKAQLYKRGFAKSEVNALANFCFLTRDTNLNISDRLPEDYFPEVERLHPGVLASQWIPSDRELWKVESYGDFLASRRALLSDEANKVFDQLLHGKPRWLVDSAPARLTTDGTSIGGIASEAEELELVALNEWIAGQGLPPGEMAYDYADPDTGIQRAIFDLAWPDGLQYGLTEPVAVLLNETHEVLSVASSAGFRSFTTVAGFKDYVESEILRLEAA